MDFFGLHILTFLFLTLGSRNTAVAVLPFSADKKNHLQPVPCQAAAGYPGIVGMIPVDLNLADFKYPGNVLNPIQVGRLELLFEFTLDPDQESLNQSWWRAAFIHVFEPFADERDAPLYRHNGTGKDCLGNTLVQYDCISLQKMG